MTNEESNMAQISMLNQRGGRALSVVDLMHAGTIAPQMAALCWLLLEQGAGLLTGAVPGGAGKTTLMAALMAFLPADEPILTVADADSLEAAEDAGTPPSTLLAHEIGRGHVYGYLWGGQAARFLALGAGRHRCVTCLHADGPEEAHQQLLGIGVAATHLAATPLQLYMRVDGASGATRRRVSSLNWAQDGTALSLYEWDPASDGFVAAAGRPACCAVLAGLCGARPEQCDAEWQRRTRFLQDLGDRRRTDYAGVRAEVLAFDRS